jgi:NAD(P)-dependent dehydrogenase (short-subunit alcohol dehydrogenase family)
MDGGGPAAYRILKTAVNARTLIVAGKASGNMKLNSIGPGWVRTRMGSASASRSVEQGADTVVWAAPLLDNGQWPY